jgi:protein-L-isoaspartate(D-aspartate) O-methyltransferase
MVEHALARRAMMDSQVSPSSVTDRRLLAAMAQVPRELFVPPARRDIAYIDDHHALGGGRYLLAPAAFARLVQLARVGATDSVLAVDVGTGYGATILAALADNVTGIEPDPALADAARANLAALGIGVPVLSGPAEIDSRTFDVIVVETALGAVPEHLMARLRPGGRLVAFLRKRSIGVAMRFTAARGVIESEAHFDTTLPPAPGERVEEFVF